MAKWDYNPFTKKLDIEKMGAGSSGKWKYNPFTKKLDIVGVATAPEIGYPVSYDASNDVIPAPILPLTVLGLLEGDSNGDMEVADVPEFPEMEKYFDVDANGDLMPMVVD